MEMRMNCSNIDCPELYGRCRVLGDAAVCECWPGLTGPSCRDDATNNYTGYRQQIMMAFCVLVTLAALYAYAAGNLFVVKRSRRVLMLTATLTLFSGLVYYSVALISSYGPSSGPAGVAYLVAYWLCGLYYMLNFMLHTQCLVFYQTMLASKFHRFKGLMKFSRLPILFSMAVAITVEFYICFWTILAKASNQRFNTYMAFYVRHLVRSIAFAIFATILAFVTAVYFVRIWKNTGSLVLPLRGRRELDAKRKREFVSPEYDHPGNEFDIPFLKRKRLFMILFILAELLFSAMGWYETYILVTSGRDQWADLLSVCAREVAFMSELAGIVWTFGYSPLADIRMTSSAREYMDAQTSSLFSTNNSLDEEQGADTHLLFGGGGGGEFGSSSSLGSSVIKKSPSQERLHMPGIHTIGTGSGGENGGAQNNLGFGFSGSNLGGKKSISKSPSFGTSTMKFNTSPSAIPANGWLLVCFCMCVFIFCFAGIVGIFLVVTGVLQSHE